MNLTLTAQQRLNSFEDFTRSVIELSCEYSMVHIDELLGGSKKKEVSNLRSVICVIFIIRLKHYRPISVSCSFVNSYFFKASLTLSALPSVIADFIFSTVSFVKGCLGVVKFLFLE